MSSRAKYLGALLVVTIATALGIAAAWPIYQTTRLLIVAAAGLVLGYGIAALCARRVGIVTSCVVLFVVYALSVAPIAVPSSLDDLPGSLGSGVFDGIAGIVLGWKQLLTLALPVSDYQAVLVPAYLVYLLSAFIATTIILRAGRFAPTAAFVLTLPVAFGTVFGTSLVSPPLTIGPITVAAPRELALWLAVVSLGALWVWFAAGARRRAALRRGRVHSDGRGAAGRLTRGLFGAATVIVALAAGLVLAPMLDSGTRQAPRDRIDPEIVLRAQPSLLASYRASKRDASLDSVMFSVAAGAALPERLRLAVLDTYDGVDFHISADAMGRFTRYPSAGSVNDPTVVAVTIGEGYGDIWVANSGLGSVPAFTGDRAAALAEAFFVNRRTETAIAVPGGVDTQGLIAGDGYELVMSGAPSPTLSGAPASATPLFDVDLMPELAAWLQTQDQPATAEGLTELIERLRARGYLSHSISGGAGESLWIDRLSARYGTQFESSVGGHSVSRLEQMFAQLNTQQRLVTDTADPAALVAAIGDDEQFAAAAALIARALGFESRVVVGVRLGNEAAGVPGVPACQADCTGEHLAAWVEVRGQAGAWVPIDVTPQVTLPPTGLDEGEQLPEFATTPEERDAREVDPPLGLGEQSDDAEQPEEEPQRQGVPVLLRAALLGVAGLTFLIVPLLFLPVAKRLRARARRREPDPELRSLGAWQQMLDSASDAGVDIDRTASRAAIAETLGTAPAQWAAGIAEKAVFSAQGVTEQEAEWMWAAADADRAERSATMGAWQRWRATYSLRSLRNTFTPRRTSTQESARGSVEKEPQHD